MKGRHAAELIARLEDAVRLAVGLARDGGCRPSGGSSTRSTSARRLGAIRTRLVAARRPAGGRRRAPAASGRRGAAQLRQPSRTLSPLAVLGRGYAVCWNADRTRALRDAGEVAPGDTVRVTLSRGEIEAKVSKRNE